jgi:GMP synthase-like glutamine amidotransferase
MLDATAPRVRFLRHHDEDDPGLVGAAFERLGYGCDAVLVDDDAVSIELDGIAALAILGSKWSVYDDGAVGGWIDLELDAIREADRRSIPVLGICFGAQALCAALGGRVEPAPHLELGWVELLGDEAAGVPSGPWFQFHADRCVLPPGATLLASNDVGAQAFRIGRHLGVQFHPEIDARQLSRWMEAGAAAVAESAGVSAQALVTETATRESEVTPRVARLVEGFLDRAA